MAIIGEMQRYLAEADGNPIVNPQWVFQGGAAANMFVSYVVSGSGAIPTPCTNFQQDELDVYYVGTGDVAFTVTGTVNGQFAENGGTNTYVGPDINTMDADTGIWRVQYATDGAPFLELGNAQQPGIVFELDITLPEDDFGDGSGTVFFCQLLAAATLQYNGPNDRQFFQQISAPMLDGAMPYANIQTSGGADDALQLSMNDSPTLPLPAANCDEVSVSLDFVTYAMYQSSSDLGALPVAVGYRSWTTQVHAVNTPVTGWEIIGPNEVFATPLDEIAELPTWEGNTEVWRQQLLAGLQQAFG